MDFGQFTHLTFDCYGTLIDWEAGMMFAQTAKHLRVPFDAVITAQQVSSYKPALNHFQVALERLEVAPGKILHVAQSIYHDHAPAKQLGLTTVRVNRKSRLGGTGLALPAEATPDFEVPDLISLTAAIGLNSARA